MKILIYCYTFYPINTGYANAFKNFIDSISKDSRNLSITVVTPIDLGDFSELEMHNVSFIRFKDIYQRFGKFGQLIGQIRASKFINKLFIRDKYDVLFVETVDQVFFLAFLSKNIKSKTAVRIHATNETELTFFGKSIHYKIRKYMLEKVISKQFNWFSATNEYHINFIKKYFFKDNQISIANKFFYVLPNAVKVECNIETNAFKDKIKLVTLGRMDYIGDNQKGFTDVFRAIKSLSPDLLNKIELKVIGSGNMRSIFMEQMKSYGSVVFIESMNHNDVIETLKNSDAVLLASRYEGLSMFALESLATGNICLFSRTGGLANLVDGNGFFFDPQNIEQLVKCLISLTALDAEVAIAMKMRSLEIVKNNFQDDIISKKFNLLCEFINE